MISKICLRNFKAFEQLQMDLAPISLLFGPNNSGKSSIIAPLRLLVQTLESYDSQVPLLLDGIMGDFGTYKDIVYGNHRGRPMEICVTLRPTHRRIDPSSPQDFWPSVDTDTIEIALGYKYRTKRRELILKNTEIKLNNSPLLATAYSAESERQLIEKVGEKRVPPPIKSSFAKIMRMQNFLVKHVFLATDRSKGGALREFITQDVERTIKVAGRMAGEMHKHLLRVDYLGAMRMPPSRTYLFTGERRRRIGASGEHSASILVMDSARTGSRSLNVIGRVREWLEQAGIAGDLRIEPISDRHYEIRVQHPLTLEYQNLADVGYGNSQVLPVLVGGFNLGTRATYMVEEPEIHLHPRAQAELGDFFVELYRNGVQSIVETHSEYLVVRLQQYVASKDLPPEHVGVYYVYPEGETKRVIPLRMDSEGRFVDNWPEGFFPERLDEAKKLAKARFQKRTAGG